MRIVALGVLVAVAVAVAGGCSLRSESHDETFASEDLAAMVAPDPHAASAKLAARRSPQTAPARPDPPDTPGFREGLQALWSGAHLARAEALLFVDSSSAHDALEASKVRARGLFGTGNRVTQMSVEGLGEEWWGLHAQSAVVDVGPAVAVVTWRRANVVLSVQIDCGLGHECEFDVVRVAGAYADLVDRAAAQIERRRNEAGG